MAPEFFVRLEDAALNAWPAPRQMIYDGWLLRFAQGYTKRANSINIRFESQLPFKEKIRVCEAIYASENLPLIFRLPDPFASPELKLALADAGYQIFDPTFVLGREIARCGAFPKEIKMNDMDIEGWIELRAKLTGTPLEHWIVHREILEVILPKKTLMGMVVNDQPVACGMGVLEGNLLGYFSIYVGERFRRCGYGKMMMWGLTNWGVDRGGRFGYLQVEGDNQPAITLYEKMGFETCYKYLYSKKL